MQLTWLTRVHFDIHQRHYPTSQKESLCKESFLPSTLTTLKWLTLEKRRFQRRCVHVYKCLNSLTHHELTLVTQQEQHSYNTRNKANLKIPSVKRNWGKQRTGYHAVSDFNSLDKTIRAADNVNILKRKIFNSLI